MKTLGTLFTITLVLLSISLTAAPVQDDSIQVVEARQKNLFVFKVDRSLMGGEVEVYHSNGDLVTALELNKRKTIIDFCDVKFGVYTIKVIKDGVVIEEFIYNKELTLSQVIR